jgi:hypothetical protein
VANTFATTHSLAVTVHGPAGVIDLVVPTAAAAVDVAQEYARQSGLDVVPALHTSIGQPIAADVSLVDAGVETGDVLVATILGARHAAVSVRRGSPVVSATGPGALSALLFCVAAAAAALAGWCAARSPSGDLQSAAVAVLAAAGLVGVLPIGRFVAHRVVAAPAFAGAAAFAVVWDPELERLPMVVGLTGLVAALTAAVGRALDRRSEEALRVWIVVGALLFVVTGLGALAGAPARLDWSVLLVGAVLAARFVPGFAVDVPDQYLIDLERLAVSAWSARQQPTGKRGRSVVPLGAIAVVATRGTRIITASGAAILAVVMLAAPVLLVTASAPIDRIGARCLVGFAGGSLLLAARSYRHTAARVLLRVAGLACWVALLVVLLGEAGDDIDWWLAIGTVLLAVLVVVVAVSVGRGWRSAWWSRRAEVAEGLCAAFALASLVVASGWFRSLWEITSLWELSS